MAVNKYPIGSLVRLHVRYVWGLDGEAMYPPQSDRSVGVVLGTVDGNNWESGRAIAAWRKTDTCFYVVLMNDGRMIVAIDSWLARPGPV